MIRRSSSRPLTRLACRLLAAGLGVAAWHATAGAQSAADFSADRFKAHVAFLADDLLEGREAGTRGHEIAARYVAAQFALLGVKPAAPDGTYFEQVQLAEWSRSGTPGTLTLTTPRGTRVFKQGVDAVIGGSPAGGTSQVKGPLVFAGYGVVDKTLGLDDYQGVDARGAIVVLLSAPMIGIDSEVAAHLQSEQAETAAEHGAVAVIGIQTHSSAKVTPWEEYVKRVAFASTTWVQRDGKPFDYGHGMRASAGVNQTAAAALFEGAPTTLDQVLSEADKPGGRPKAFALKTAAELRVTTTTRRYSSPDVVGVIEGADPQLKHEYVALMAHADHIGMNPSGSGDRINNGALDNAAGIATLLEVARAFAFTSARPKRSIMLVANTAEEKGLLGAEYFAHNTPVPADRIVAAIDLDMPLLLYDFTDVVAYGASHSTLDSAFRAAGAAMNVAVSPDPMPEQGIFVRSDHYAMAKVGVPAVMLATGMANGGQAAWASFLSTQYHHPSDDLSMPIHWQAGARFAEVNYRAVRALADAAEPPRWYAGDYFGNLFAPRAAKVRKP